MTCGIEVLGTEAHPAKAAVPAPGDTFRALRSSLPPFLEHGRVDWCERVADQTPAGARSHYLECRLEADDRIDFMSSFDRGCVGLESELTRLHGSEPSWQRNLRLIREWRTDEVLSQSHYVWLEYDAPGERGGAPLEANPSVALEDAYYLRHLTGAVPANPAAQLIAKKVLGHLLPSSGVTATVSAMDQCFRALPSTGSIAYVSVMSTRRPVTCKLYVVLPRTEACEYLRRIAWPGDIAVADTTLAQLYAPEVQTAYLDITLTDRVQERLGIPTSQFQQGELARARSGNPWLRLPSSLGEASRALLGWPGVQRATVGEIAVTIHRWLDVKAVLEHGAVQYKAYLGFMPRLRPGGG
jgi:hypothetical protein